MRVLVLGATGNIGQQTIDVIKKLKYQLVGISFNTNYKLASKLNVKYKYSPSDKLHSNVNSYDELIKKSKPDIVVNAIVGIAGLPPTIDVIKNKKTLCLANKESLVIAGKIVTKLANLNKVSIYPIDSEHASIYQILKQNKAKKFKKIYITASGGPFYHAKPELLENVSFQQAIKHPT
jgi:1-deoxy-D-xylulose-5-phosphate reductoisomerase